MRDFYIRFIIGNGLYSEFKKYSTTFKSRYKAAICFLRHKGLFNYTKGFKFSESDLDYHFEPSEMNIFKVASEEWL